MTITSIGYGDIRAPDGNTHEQVFATILMLLGGMIWGMIIATFWASSQTSTPRVLSSALPWTT